MNVLYLINAGLVGFLVSLMMLECLREVFRSNWPVQAAGLQLERRPIAWLVALLAGPALLWDQSLPYRKGRAGTRADLVLVLMLLAVWSASYGVSLGWAVRSLF